MIDIGKMTKSMADAMPEPRALECQECKRRTAITRVGAARYLRAGWPKCCGYTMRLLTENDETSTGAAAEGRP